MNNKISSLLTQLTLEEKATLTAGAGMWRTVPIERVGLPALQVSDGPNGVRGDDDNLGATAVCVPCGSALGATWNPELVRQVGGLLAREARAQGAAVLLAPTVNIPRTPVAGRNFECLSEDPYLSGTMAAAYIEGLQGEGVGACLKHFVCNDQEHERFTISADVDERPLHEIYLEPFRLAIAAARPWSVMSAYNRVNGVYVSESDFLLRTILKERWGFDGVVVSDWYGTYSERVQAGGLDLEMPGPARYMDVNQMVSAVENGTLDEVVIDDKVARLLRLMQRSGVLDGDTAVPEIDTADDRALARRAATEAIVLLKNDDDALPLDPERPQTIVVIGENALRPQIRGGGSARVNEHYAVSVLDGLRARVGADVTIDDHLGTPIHKRPPLLNMDWLTTADGAENGLTLDYFDNLDLRGEPRHTAVLRKTRLAWFGDTNPLVDPRHFSMRLRTTLTAPESGDYLLEMRSVGTAALWVDGERRASHDRTGTDETGTLGDRTAIPLTLTAGQTVTLKVEYVTAPDNNRRSLRLGLVPPQPDDPIAAAVDAAAQADAAVIVAGLTHEWEGEGGDRPHMRLVGRQDELIRRVAAVNDRTIVVLNVGSPVVMPWVDEIAAVVQAWYGGQEMGNAVAAVLCGDESPCGKLPVTLPRKLADNPAYLNYPGENGRVRYGEGVFVGYRYYDKKEIAPLFPFGHGLSYTSFAYDNLRLDKTHYESGDEIVLRVDVTNSGARAGQEVVQVYVRDEAARVARPEQELKRFAKLHLQPGQTKTVTVVLDEQALAFYDAAQEKWVAETGTFEVRVGRSSRDIRLTGRFEWVGAEPAQTAVLPDDEPFMAPQ